MSINTLLNMCKFEHVFDGPLFTPRFLENLNPMFEDTSNRSRFFHFIINESGYLNRNSKNATGILNII